MKEWGGWRKGCFRTPKFVATESFAKQPRDGPANVGKVEVCLLEAVRLSDQLAAMSRILSRHIARGEIVGNLAYLCLDVPSLRGDAPNIIVAN